jgi:acyl-coenzyme A thioesterase PaaI-like protein
VIDAFPPSDARHIVGELGLHVDQDGDTICGRAEVTAEMCIPGTDALRTSVLATWADIVTGAVTSIGVAPRIPVTLDLEVHVGRPARLGSRVEAAATLVKAGRAVVVSETRFWDGGDTPFAIAIASFVASPNPSHVFSTGFPLPMAPTRRLRVPLAERAQCRIVEPGTAEIPRLPDGLNSIGAIQGGIVSLVIEEAATSLSMGPAFVSTMNIRYLRSFATGPARAVASELAGSLIVHVTDTGSGKLGALATTRIQTVEGFQRA